ncbi:uncharacterized protein [Physcomitrium patens]|uniref:uncharacterized protein isoform X2 n=1 Tax=Physcomitrium patens TaxID=3218 RepID=UPI000D154AD2|nr:uncharacterized protein LOC112278151 isoform X2 [Physcomitrium patens]|eukprot:XP_024367072.1 uncharacterized protein LOC112278151 isoform X2 [Physcomitrella patens]
MFTDGLDTSALQWVREEQARTVTTPRTCSTPASAMGSPDITRYEYRKAGTRTTLTRKTFGLPPPQLSNVHLHSQALKPVYAHDQGTYAADDLEESVGSISGGNVRGHDDYDSGDEQESGLYSPDTSTSDSLPSGNAAGHERKANEELYDARRRLPLMADPVEVEDYYDGPLSRKNSFGKKGTPRREISGRWDTLNRKEDTSQERKENAGSRQSSIDQRDIRQGAYTGSGRFDPYYGRREDPLERHVAYTGSEKLDPDYGRSSMKVSRGPSGDVQPSEDQNLTSATELSEDDIDSDEDDHSDEDRLQRSSGKQQGAGYPKIEGYTPFERESRSTQRTVQTQPSCQRWTAAPATPAQGHKGNVESPPDRLPSRTGGPPSAPPFFDGVVLEVSEAPASSIGGSYLTGLEQQSAFATPCEPSASGQAAWQALVAYDACVRLCLRAWARGCMEAPEFLMNECSLLRNCFGLQQLLLQPHEEGSRRDVSEELGDSAAAFLQKRSIGKIKVQLRKLKILAKPHPLRSSSLSAVDTNTAALSFEGRTPSHKRSLLSTGWSAVRKMRFVPKQGTRSHNSSQRSMAYVNAGAEYVRHVSGMLKEKVSSLRHSSLAELPQEKFTCLLRLKSSSEQDSLRLKPGSGETATLLPESAGDDLLLDVLDERGNLHGRLTVHVASISDDPGDRLRWCDVYSVPDHDCVGKVQLFLSYYMTSVEVDSAKWGPVGETRAYDIVLEVAMRVQHFQRRNLRLEGSWLWLLSEFASCYGVSASYSKLRYLVCIMEVATPTEDCLVLIHDLLCPIIKSRAENSLNRQEKRLLVDVQEQVEQLLAVVFENYKSLDENSSSGLADFSGPVVGSVAPALIPAVQIYTLLHDILSSEPRNTLRNYFKTAAMKRWKRLVMETDEFLSGSSEGFLMDPLSMSSAYQKMRTLCLNVRNEVRADIEIHNKHVLPSSIDLPNISACVYDVELANRLRSFLVACPPSSPSPPVAELMLSTADFQQDLTSWRIRNPDCWKGGVDAKALFHFYIVLWIQDKRLHLLDFCKFDKERCTWDTTQHTTSPFVEEVYERIKDTLNEFEVIMNRWPEYTVALENALADIERAVIGALEKQYAEVLLPLKDVMIPKKFSLQYMQKLTRRQKPTIYTVPNQLGVMLNSLKRLLDTLRPRIEGQMKTWVACLPEDGGPGRIVFGEHLNEVTIELRAKYKNYLQSIVEKLSDNAKLTRTTKLKKILQDTREAGGESDICDRMQPLNTQLVDTISHLYDVFTPRVFVAVCRGFWDRMARDVLHFLENRKGNRSWYKGSSFALGILDDVFATQMQRLQGGTLQEKDLDPPRSVAEARSLLSRDAQNGTDSSSLFFY